MTVTTDGPPDPRQQTARATVTQPAGSSGRIDDQPGAKDPGAPRTPSGPRTGVVAADPIVRWVPEAAAIGASVVLIAALLRRRRRGRALARAVRGDDEEVVEADEPAVAFESRAAAFADAPVLDWLELANRHLTAALRAEGRAEEAPEIHLVRVGPKGVDLFLGQAMDWAPGAFSLGADGQTWRLDSAVDRDTLWATAGGDLAWLPVLVPVGDGPDGTYLLHLSPGTEVSVDGPGAPEMVRAWKVAATSWPWAEQTPVAEDAQAAEYQVVDRAFADQVTVDERGTVLYLGDPAALSALAAETVARVGTDVPGAEVRVVVSDEQAVIEPYGVVVRPCALDPEVERVLEAAQDERSLMPAAEPVRVETNDGGPSSPSQGVLDDLVAPGPIEVRLLTFTPSLVGLASPLPSDRVVRITELVAWVAIHGERGTTGAAIIDHGIAGAGSEKTIYNIVSAARSALGDDASGSPRLVTDRSTGLYRVSGEVTVDVLRLEQMAEAGVKAEDPAVAAILCDAALGLIEDTPVGNGSGRYGWWSGMWEGAAGPAGHQGGPSTSPAGARGCGRGGEGPGRHRAGEVGGRRGGGAGAGGYEPRRLGWGPPGGRA